MTSLAHTAQRPGQRDPLSVFLFFSLIAHTLLFLLFPTLYRLMPEPAQEQLTEVELLPPAPPPTPPVIAKAEPPRVAPPQVVPPPQEKPKPIEKPKPPVEKPKPPEQVKPKPPEPKPEKKLPEQIVNPPDQVNDQIPEKTRLLSDHNSATKEETVKRGMPHTAPALKEKSPIQKNTGKEEQAEEAKKEPKDSPPDKTLEELEKELSAQEKPRPGTQEATKPPIEMAMKPPLASPTPKREREQKLARELDEESLEKRASPKAATGANKQPPKLFARADELQGWLSDQGKGQEEKAERHPPKGSEIIAMVPPPAPRLLPLPDPEGTPDDLPDIRQGNLTFLNAKANRFAPFVRRVALRVFQHLIIFQRKNLHINDVVAAHDMATIEAKIDKQGNLKKLLIQTRSGSYAVDEALLKACENGAWDENPPEEAVAEDGLIHFIFRSDINAQFDDLGLRGILTTLQVGLV